MKHYVYVAGQEAGPVKIGITQNVQTRIKTLRCASPVYIDTLHAFAFEEDPSDVERAIHHHLEANRLNGEWFDIPASVAKEAVETVATTRRVPFSPTPTKLRGWKPRKREKIAALGGRPRKANAKVAVTIRLEPDVLDEWKAKGPDWRSLMEERLRG